jgi:hypothetical protein
MANMSIGGNTLRHNPTSMDPFEAEKSCATEQTHGGGAYLSWGLFLIGTEKKINWSRMEADEYATLKTLYEADAPVVVDPQDGSGKTYNVEIRYFNGKLFRRFGFAAGTFRTDVQMTLFILGEAVTP